MTAPRFQYDAATGSLVGLGPVLPVRVRLDGVELIAARWRLAGHVEAADALEAAAAEVGR